jgi:ABC-type maltose transport system permease subunit
MVPASVRLNETGIRTSARHRWARRLTNALLYVFLLAVALTCLLPFYFMLSGSLMDRGEMFRIPPHFWPEKPIFENYRQLFRMFPFLTYLRNSAIVSVAQTAGVPSSARWPASSSPSAASPDGTGSSSACSPRR